MAGSGTSSPSGGSQIDPLYGAWAVEPSESSIDASDNVLARIDEAEAVLGGYLVKGVVSIGLVINPLLDVWDAAHCIDPGVSSPVELPPNRFGGTDRGFGRRVDVHPGPGASRRFAGQRCSSTCRRALLDEQRIDGAFQVYSQRPRSVKCQRA